jgi:hypothetical protein
VKRRDVSTAHVCLKNRRALSHSSFCCVSGLRLFHRIILICSRGHLAGVGLDVLPVEPPVEAIPELLRACRAREPWCEGRLIITPPSAFFTPEA